MAWGSESGPVAGSQQTAVFDAVYAASGTNIPFIFTFPCDGRLLAVSIRSAGTKADGSAATGTITGYKLRRHAASQTAVVATDTQMLDQDGGAIAANAYVLIDPDQAAGTGIQLLAAQRQFSKGDQVGLFITTDATAGGNTVTVEFSWYSHPAGGSAVANSVEALGAAQVRTVNETD